MPADKARQGPTRYEIVTQRRLDERWARRFGDMTLTALPDGTTRICRPVADQLHRRVDGWAQPDGCANRNKVGSARREDVACLAFAGPWLSP